MPPAATDVRLHAVQAFAGRVLMLGFGCIGRGVLPLLLRHLSLTPERVVVVSPDAQAQAGARAAGAVCELAALTPASLDQVLRRHLRRGDFLLNVSVGVSSVALLDWCQRAGVLYLDTCTEPWAGGYTDAALPPSARSNHALRRAALALRQRSPGGPTAVLTHGANPGLVSHFVRQALLDLAADAGLAHERPRRREDWALLAQRLGVLSIQIAERDMQYSARRRAAGEFVNTWSAEALVAEACQPAELGWGTHERHFPADALRPADDAPGVVLQRPGGSQRVRSWTPLGGPMQGWLITHAESLSLADWLTLGPADAPQYRPTVHYAYRPCDDAMLSLHELAESGWCMPARRHVLGDDIVGGVNELGVLLLGHRRGAYWYGSQLSIEQARAACADNNATSLQVAAAVMAGMVWAVRHTDQGIVEPEALPFDDILSMCAPYLGTVVGRYSDWTPLTGRGKLFEEDCDRDDPWQFKNVRVV